MRIVVDAALGLESDVAEHRDRAIARLQRRPTPSASIASTICRPTVISGFSDDIGSW